MTCGAWRRTRREGAGSRPSVRPSVRDAAHPVRLAVAAEGLSPANRDRGQRRREADGGQRGQGGHTPRRVHLGREGPERQGSAEGAPPPDREGSGKREVSGLQRCAFHRCKRVCVHPWRESTCRVRILRGEKESPARGGHFPPPSGSSRPLPLLPFCFVFGTAFCFVLFCFSGPPLGRRSPSGWDHTRERCLSGCRSALGGPGTPRGRRAFPPVTGPCVCLC